MNTPTTAQQRPATIPDYAHPVPVGADGLRFRKFHGPRTLASTERRQRVSAYYARELAARAKNNPFTAAEYMAVTP